MTDSGFNFTIRPILDSDLDDVLALYRACEDFLALGPIAGASPEMVAGDRALSQRLGFRITGPPALQSDGTTTYPIQRTAA